MVWVGKENLKCEVSEKKEQAEVTDLIQVKRIFSLRKSCNLESQIRVKKSDGLMLIGVITCIKQ